MSKNLDDIVITNALRTPIGKYKGSLSSYQAHDLGAKVIEKLLKNSKISPEDVNEVVMGQVLTGNTGQNPARQAAIKANIPNDKTAYIINQVCGSGLRSIVSGYQNLKLNDDSIILAGGQGTRNSIFHIIHNEYGAKKALDCVYSFHQISNKFLLEKG